MTKSEAVVKISPKTITKKFKKRKDGKKHFLNELYVYLLAKQKNIKCIPKLLSYSIENQTIVTENVGRSLDYIPEEDWQEREKHLPGISKIYKVLEKYKLYHNYKRNKIFTIL